MPRDGRLVALHLHQRYASLDERERLTEIVRSAPAGGDVIALLTCHRVEAYAVLDADADPRAALARRLGLAPEGLGDATVETDEAAAEHLLRVAAGLESAIVGEGQIACQVRRCYEAARATGTHPILAGLFQRALRLSRTLRTSSELGQVRRSVGSLAVDVGVSLLPSPERATALVIGAGEVGKLAARALAQRVGQLVIANRDRARAEAVASPVGARAIGIDAVGSALGAADLVISAADTRGALLGRDVLAARCSIRALVLIDIAVPRSVGEDARSLEGLVYRDVDDIATSSPAVSAETLAEGARRCAAEARDLMAWLRSRDAVPTIRALRDRATRIQERQLSRAMRHLGHLSERDRRSVRALAAALTNEMLHEPTVRLRSMPELEHPARTLFGVDT